MKPIKASVAFYFLASAMAWIALGWTWPASAQDLSDLDLDLGQFQDRGLGSSNDLLARLKGLALGVSTKATAGSIVFFNLGLLLFADLTRRFRQARGFEQMIMSRWQVHRRDDDPSEARIEMGGRAPGWPNLFLSWIGMGVTVEFVAAYEQARLRRIAMTNERHWAIHLGGHPSCALKFERERFWLFLAIANLGYALVWSVDSIALLVLLLAMGGSLCAYFFSGRYLLEIADKIHLRIAFTPSFIDGMKLERAEAVSAFNLLQEMISASTSRRPGRFEFESKEPSVGDNPEADYEEGEPFDDESAEDDADDDLGETEPPSLEQLEAGARRILERLKRLPKDDPQWAWKMKTGLELVVRDYPGTPSAQIAATSLARHKTRPAGERLGPSE